MSYTPTKIEEEAIKLVRDEKNDWKEGEVQLTEDIAFKCRNIIKRARKNYFNIYDKPYDPVTNRKKLFVPLTRDMVETTVKNIDIDTKDIEIKAKTPNSYLLAGLCKMILRSELDKMRFGQILNRIIRKCAVEGVAVIKHMRIGKKSVISIPENLNFYTDPTVSYLKDSSGNIEVNWLTVNEVNEYPWDNLKDIVGQKSIARIEDLTTVTTEIPHVEITERWGLIPKYFITEKEEDKEKYIEGIIIISNLNNGPVVHLIDENKRGVRPYVEFRTKQFDGRWLGFGIGEDLFDLQAYSNEIVNIRLNTSRIKQLGLFQIRKGSGITPQMLNQLYSGGAVQVSGMDKDIRELRTSDVKSSSYKDEEQAYTWAQRMTGAWEVGRGESLPASQPATTAVLQERGMQTGFSLQQEELGFSISRFIETLFLPAILEGLTEEDIVRVTDDPEFLRDLDDTQITNIINSEIVAYHKKHGYYPDSESIEKEREKAVKEFRKLGRDRFIRIKKELLAPDKILDYVDVYVTSENLNKSVLARQLNDLLINYSNIPGINIDINLVVKELLDLMGLSGERFLKKQEEIPQPISPTGGPMVKQSNSRLPEEIGRVVEEETGIKRGRALVPTA